MATPHPDLNSFVNRDGKLDLFDTHPLLWSPPTVTLVQKAPRLPSCPEAGTGPCLIYPEDDHRQWPRKTETTGLLDAFLRLADLTLTERQDAEKVQAFAQTWGPLWLCQTPGHRGYGSADCFYLAWPPKESPNCIWHPQEPGAVFVRKAQEAKAVLNIVEALRANKPVRMASWEATGLDRREQGFAHRVARMSRASRCTWVANIVSCHLLSYDMPTLLMTWENARGPRLVHCHDEISC
jgi:hypothetical protein